MYPKLFPNGAISKFYLQTGQNAKIDGETIPTFWG